MFLSMVMVLIDFSHCAMYPRMKLTDHHAKNKARHAKLIALHDVHCSFINELLDAPVKRQFLRVHENWVSCLWQPIFSGLVCLTTVVTL